MASGAPPPSSAEPVRVLVVDDQEVFRRGLEVALGVEPDIVVVAVAADGVSAVERAAASTPDVVLLDIRMPRASGIEACAGIRAAVPTAKIVMLTMSDDEGDLFEAVAAGAMGYLLKDASIEKIIVGIRAVHGGGSPISPAMAAPLLNRFRALLDSGTSLASTPAPRLTERETGVLRLVAQGLSNRDIARQLSISENTVKNHVRHILVKLQLHSRMEAVVYTVREKLLVIT